MFAKDFDPDQKQNFVREFRDREHMSQQTLLKIFKQAADGRVKITQSQLSDIENGRKPLSVEKASVMCRIFNCRVEEIINMNYLDINSDTIDNTINLNLFSTEQLKTIKAAIDLELQKRDSI